MSDAFCGSAFAVFLHMNPDSQAGQPVCIIPARGGSKRILRKNVKSFCGKPMMQWSIEAAHRTGCFEQVIVSTDCHEIADVAKACGALVPFMRPAELSDDHTITASVIRHAIDVTLGKLMPERQPICCLYATAPFVTAQDIVQSLDKLDVSEFVMPVTRFGFPVQRAARLNEKGELQMFHPEHYRTRSQDLEEAWHDTGQFYWATAQAWRSERSPFELGASAYPIPRWRVQDIDTPEDWQRAELMFEALYRENG